MGMSRNLDHFVGKICTVFTVPLNRDFKAENPTIYPQQIINYFVGTVEFVDEDGLMLVQSSSPRQLRTYIFRNALVAIAEEHVVVERPAAPKTIQQPKQPVSPHLNVASLETLTKTWSNTVGSGPK